MADTLEKAKKGDAEAFAELYSQYAKDFYRFAYCMLKVREDAEDCVQEAAVSVYKHLIDIRKMESFKAYFFTVLANTCKYRLKKRASEQTEPFDELAFFVADSSSENISLSLELQQAILKLDDDERFVVILSSVAGMKSAEIGKITGLTSGAIRSKRSRSFQKLREELSK